MLIGLIIHTLTLFLSSGLLLSLFPLTFKFLLSRGHLGLCFGGIISLLLGDLLICFFLKLSLFLVCLCGSSGHLRGKVILEFFLLFGLLLSEGGILGTLSLNAFFNGIDLVVVFLVDSVVVLVFAATALAFAELGLVFVDGDISGGDHARGFAANGI